MSQTIVRAIDTNGDWTFGQGRSNYLSGRAALAQQIRCRLLQFLNECFFDLNAGIDWFNLLGGNNELLLQLAISTVILNTQGVTGLLQISVDVSEKRAFTIQYSATTVYSTVTQSVFHQMVV